MDEAYDPHHWHDDTLYAVRFVIGDPETGDWRAELVLDLDHITAWERGEDGRVRFRVAPATLTFHDVADLRIAIDWGDSGHQTMLHACAIDRIERLAIRDRKIRLDCPYWSWQILLNWPGDGVVSFGASGHTLTLRAAPVLQDEQQLAAPRSGGP